MERRKRELKVTVLIIVIASLIGFWGKNHLRPGLWNWNIHSGCRRVRSERIKFITEYRLRLDRLHETIKKVFGFVESFEVETVLVSLLENALAGLQIREGRIDLVKSHGLSSLEKIQNVVREQVEDGGFDAQGFSFDLLHHYIYLGIPSLKFYKINLGDNLTDELKKIYSGLIPSEVMDFMFSRDGPFFYIENKITPKGIFYLPDLEELEEVVERWKKALDLR